MRGHIEMPYPADMMGLLLSLSEPGKRLVDAGELKEAFEAIFGANTNVIGGAAAPGPTLQTYFSLVTSGTDVSLPPAIPGRQMLVLARNGAVTVNAAISNPANGGVADDIVVTGAWTGAASESIDEGAPTLYVCYALGHWLQVTL
jgi:hypothetical protein